MRQRHGGAHDRVKLFESTWSACKTSGFLLEIFWYLYFTISSDKSILSHITIVWHTCNIHGLGAIQPSIFHMTLCPSTFHAVFCQSLFIVMAGFLTFPIQSHVTTDNNTDNYSVCHSFISYLSLFLQYYQFGPTLSCLSLNFWKLNQFLHPWPPPPSPWCLMVFYYRFMVVLYLILQYIQRSFWSVGFCPFSLDVHRISTFVSALYLWYFQ